MLEKILTNTVQEFSTSGADYRLHYAWHTRQSAFDETIDYDALVLETGLMFYEEVGLRELVNNEQYRLVVGKTLIRNAVSDKVTPLFYTDVPPARHLRSKIMTLEAACSTLPLVASILYLPYTLPFALPVMVGCLPLFSGYGDRCNKAIAYLNMSRMYDSSAYRSAVTAQKIEEFIVPELTARLGRRPLVYIEFGAAHCDIEPYLKHPSLRHASMRAHQYWFPLLDYSYVSKVCELRPKGAPEPKHLESIVGRHDEPSIGITSRGGDEYTLSVPPAPDALVVPWRRIEYQMATKCL
ncbi:hypothetical protein HY639_05515 [Candidatus Woesearchaeota archaeon]|nr:hypothetical protein [Candidatus Woesearchaeota archaeon]